MTAFQQRHTLYLREAFGESPVRVREFKSYGSAVKAGMTECGHGKFFVDSERRHEGSVKWTEFAPQPVNLHALTEVEMDFA